MSTEDLIKTIYDIEEMVETDPEDHRREILHRLIEVRADIARLRCLVQAQKELIDWYAINVELYPSAIKETESLFNKIKSLEA